MDSISPYYIILNEDGWSVIERSSGGPVEVQDDDERVLLCKLDKELAEEWSRRLNARARMFGRKNPPRP